MFKINNFGKLYRIHVLIIIISTTVSLLTGCDNNPKSYDDCILQNMHEVKSDKGAILVMQSCAEKFPKGSEIINVKTRELTSEELSMLDGRAGLSYGNHYSGTMYNGNNNLAVTELRINVQTTISGEQNTLEYLSKVTIQPLSTKDFDFDIIVGDKGAEYSWSIAGARGYTE